jgi:hypothetical protein
MVEQGLSDHGRARRKAAERMGILDRRQWPSNESIQEAVLTQRRLFPSAGHERDGLNLREEAVQAMRIFRDFLPRLVGSALTGAGDRQAGVELFLFAEHPEEVIFHLIERRIPWRESERDFQYPDGQRRAHPAFQFLAGETPFQLIVLPPRARRQPPLDPITERPWRGADLEDVEQLLANTERAYRCEIGM